MGNCGSRQAVTLEEAVLYGWSLRKITRLLESEAHAPTELSCALVQVAERGSKDIVLLLLDRGADINVVVDGEYGTALAAAAYRGKTSTVSLLLDRGADIDMVVDGKYGTALAAAAYWGDRATASLLLDRGADINMVGGKYGTALAAATNAGTTGIVSLLLSRGANIDTVGGECGTALAAAARRGNRDAVSLLLDRGADIDMVVGGEYGTALAAAASCSRRSTDALSQLLDRGADINRVGGKYGTALAAAAYHGFIDAVSLLLDRGADIDMVVDGEYGTALGAGIFYASKDTMPLLLDRGADFNIVDQQRRFPNRGTLDMGAVPLLLDRGADMNTVTSEFGTILGRAIYSGSTEIAHFLLDHGADVLRVGGCYNPASGVYPSALDVAHSVGSRVDPSLLLRLQTAIRERHEPLVDDIVSRSPFPMPCAQPRSPLCANHPQQALSPILKASFDILSTHDYAGGKITPEQADVPCQELGEEVLHRTLVALVGLNRDTAQAKYQWIVNDVRYFVACNLDFGTAYTTARVAWEHFNEHSSRIISIHRGRWHKHARALDEVRAKAIEIDFLQQELILSPYSIMPRRIWDLRSNRVVDFRMLHAAQSTTETRPTFWAVTHSWTCDMPPVLTSINQHQWPVPLPKDISLENVRSELLSLGAEYVWIDVLCLRQQSEVDSLEQIRKEEWKLDVPTIGNIYRAAAHIVRYFNGLGVHFSNKHWDDPRHWLQRAWTLQEIAAESTTINGGIPRDLGKVFLNSPGEISGKVITLRSALRPVIQLAAQVDSQHGCELYELAREMSRRHATQPVDKLSGLFYLLRTTKLPCYDAKRTSEDVWGQCFRLLPIEKKAEVLLNFPYRGSEEQWFPTWSQVLNWPVRDPEYDLSVHRIPSRPLLQEYH